MGTLGLLLMSTPAVSKQPEPAAGSILAEFVPTTDTATFTIIGSALCLVSLRLRKPRD